MKLEKGDRIYRCHSGKPSSIMVIDRTTKTQAVSGTTKFRIECSGWISVIGGSSYSRVSYYLETPKLIEEYNRVKLLRKVSSIKFDELSDDKLQDIVNVL